MRDHLIWPVALGVLAGLRLRLRRPLPPPGSEGLFLVPNWGLPR